MATTQRYNGISKRMVSETQNSSIAKVKCEGWLTPREAGEHYVMKTPVKTMGSIPIDHCDVLTDCQNGFMQRCGLASDTVCQPVTCVTVVESTGNGNFATVDSSTMGWRICDLHLMNNRVWLPLLLLFLSVFPVPVEGGVMETAGDVVLLSQAFLYASIALSVLFVSFYVGLMFKQLPGILDSFLKSFLTTFESTVCGSINKLVLFGQQFLAVYEDTSRKQLMMSAAGVGMSFMFGLSGLCFGPTQTFTPEGNTRNRINGGLKSLAALFAALSFFQALWSSPEEARKGAGAWSSILRDNYLVWGIARLWKLARNIFRGDAWDKGFDTHAFNAGDATSLPKPWKSQAGGPTPTKPFQPVSESVVQDVLTRGVTSSDAWITTKNRLVKGGGGKMENGDLVLLGLPEGATSDVNAINRLGEFLTGKLQVRAATLYGPYLQGFGARLSAALASLSTAEYRQLQFWWLRHKAHIVCDWTIPCIVDRFTSLDETVFWTLVLSGPEAPIVLRWLNSHIVDPDAPPDSSNCIDITPLVWLSAHLGFGYEVSKLEENSPRWAVKIKCDGIWLAMGRFLKAQTMDVDFPPTLGGIGSEERARYEMWRADVQWCGTIVDREGHVYVAVGDGKRDCDLMDNFQMHAASMRKHGSISSEMLVKPEPTSLEKALAEEKAEATFVDKMNAIAKKKEVAIKKMKPVAFVKAQEAQVATELNAQVEEPQVNYDLDPLSELDHSDESESENDGLPDPGAPTIQGVPGLTDSEISSSGSDDETKCDLCHSRAHSMKNCNVIWMKDSFWKAQSLFGDGPVQRGADGAPITGTPMDGDELSELEKVRIAKGFIQFTSKPTGKGKDTAFARALIWMCDRLSAVGAVPALWIEGFKTNYDQERNPGFFMFVNFLLIYLGIQIGAHASLALVNRYVVPRYRKAGVYTDDDYAELKRKFVQMGYNIDHWPEAKFGNRFAARHKAQRPRKGKGQVQHSGGVEVSGYPDHVPGPIEYDADYAGEALAETLVDRLADRVVRFVDTTLSPGKAAGVLAAAKVMKDAVEGINVPDHSDLQKRAAKLKGVAVKVEKKGGVRKAVRKEALLGKRQLIVDHYLPRLFKVSFVEKGVLMNKTHYANAWLHGDCLITSWHLLRHACGAEYVVEGKTRYLVTDSFEKAWNFNAAYNRGSYIERLPDVHADLGFMKLLGVGPAPQRIALDAPTQAENVWFLGWDHADEGYTPKVANGMVNASGYHNCPTVEGDCGGVLISSASGAVVGFHNGGGDFNNRASPVTDGVKVALKGASQLHLN